MAEVRVATVVRAMGPLGVPRDVRGGSDAVQRNQTKTAVRCAGDLVGLPMMKVDMVAVRRVGEKIARGLHYRIMGERLQGDVVVWSSRFVGGHPRVRGNLQVYAAAIDQVGYQREGFSGHPLVFEYGHKVDTLRRAVFMRLRFFRGFELRVMAVSPWLTGLEEKPLDWPERLA
jgi:hypothetical protein